MAESRTPLLKFSMLTITACILLVSHLMPQLVEEVFKYLIQHKICLPLASFYDAELCQQTQQPAQLLENALLQSGLPFTNLCPVISSSSYLVWSFSADTQILLHCVHLHSIFHWNKETFHLLPRLLFLYSTILRNKWVQVFPMDSGITFSKTICSTWR